MNKSQRYEYLKGFEFSSCHVRTKEIIAFAAQKCLSNDPLEQRETAIFAYYPGDPPETRWAMTEIGYSLGIRGCAAFLPEERWVFVTSDGLVYVAGMGDNDYENPISKKKDLYITNVRSIGKGHALAVGLHRKVFIRQAANNWLQRDEGLFPQGSDTNLKDAGFRDIGGFDEKDLYACGGKGDLWHYDGRLWSNIDIPTNSDLNKICCADDGFVYILTSSRDIIKGRGQTWEVILQDATKEVLEEIVCYRGKVLVSTMSELYIVDGMDLKVADLGMPKMNIKGHMAVGDGILVVAGNDESVMYDGNSWSVILESEK